jgi:hypothetical protein
MMRRKPAVSSIRSAKESFKFFGGNEIDGFFGGLMQDHSVDAWNTAADSTAAVSNQASDAAASQTYAMRQDSIPLPDPTNPSDARIQLLDSGGQRLSWTELGAYSKKWVVDHWSTEQQRLPDGNSRVQCHQHFRFAEGHPARHPSSETPK